MRSANGTRSSSHIRSMDGCCNMPSRRQRHSPRWAMNTSRYPRTDTCTVSAGSAACTAGVVRRYISSITDAITLANASSLFLKCR